MRKGAEAQRAHVGFLKKAGRQEGLGSGAEVFFVHPFHALHGLHGESKRHLQAGAGAGVFTMKSMKGMKAPLLSSSRPFPVRHGLFGESGRLCGFASLREVFAGRVLGISGRKMGSSLSEMGLGGLEIVVGATLLVIGRAHLVVGRIHLVVGRTHLVVGRTHLVIGRTHLVIGRSHLVIGRTHLVIGRTHLVVGRTVLAFSEGEKGASGTEQVANHPATTTTFFQWNHFRRWGPVFPTPCGPFESTKT